jgi:hypothetical protein
MGRSMIRYVFVEPRTLVLLRGGESAVRSNAGCSRKPKGGDCVRYNFAAKTEWPGLARENL